MKELLTKEKAKAYDEALKRAKKLATDLPNGRNDRLYYVWDLESIFPELKESEEEKIINFIANELMCLRAIESNSGGKGSDRYKEITNAIAWLQKQGKKNLENSAKTFKDEQNYPADKVKPKFKVGDIIRSKYDERKFTIKTVNLEGGFYTYTQDGCGNDIDYADDVFELVEQNPTWSEEDEKMFNSALWHIKNSCSNGRITSGEGEVYHWLKTIKDRVHQNKSIES